MTTTATLDETVVSLDAGGHAVIPLQIRNDSEIVEGYSIEVVGAPAAWTTVAPAELWVYPHTTTTTTLEFSPPRSAGVPAGRLPFGVRVVPTERPDEAVVPEGVVEVLPFLETTAELTPRTSRGRGGARHRVAIDNRGNVPVTVTLLASGASDALGVNVRPEGLTVQAGHAAFIAVRVRPADMLWRGQPVTHPFTVRVTPHAGLPVPLEGSHLQEPVLPAWWLRALLALLALLIALAFLWFGVMKPTIASAAKDAVAKPVEQAQVQAAAAKQQADQAGAAAEGAALDAKSARAAAAAAGKTGTVPPVAAPLSARLQVKAPAKGRALEEFTVPLGRTMELTDIVLQNPQGDFGRVQISMGDRVLLALALENFRDIDYHFVTPIRGTAGEALRMTVDCNTVGAPPGVTAPLTTCDTALYYGGTLATQPAT